MISAKKEFTITSKFVSNLPFVSHSTIFFCFKCLRLKQVTQKKVLENDVHIKSCAKMKNKKLVIFLSLRFLTAHKYKLARWKFQQYTKHLGRKTFSINTQYCTETCSEPCQTSKIELFAKTVMGFQLLITFVKPSNLDVWHGYKHASAI